MTITAQFYCTLRSPYAYLASHRYQQIQEQWAVDIQVCPVLPISVRHPTGAEAGNPRQLAYIELDSSRVAEFLGLPLTNPQPDPVFSDPESGRILVEQPLIHWLTHLTTAAERYGRGFVLFKELSSLIWGSGLVNWHEGDHIKNAIARVDLEPRALFDEVSNDKRALADQVTENQNRLKAAGHWGVPTLVVDGEPFFGQDRAELALWRMQQLGLKKR